MNPLNKTARLAGFLYLSMVFTAPLSLIYIPNKIIVRTDAAATANNLRAHEMLFRTGIVLELAGTVLFLFVVLTLYRLLRGVNRNLARTMAVLAIVSIPISFLNLVNELAALLILRGGEFLTGFTKPQLEGLALLFLRLYGRGVLVNEVFWGLWLFPFGVLVMRSGFLPRILGILLVVNAFSYPAVTLTTLLLPDYVPLVSRIALPMQFGELWIMLWLIIRGVNVRHPAVAAHERVVAA